jgi:hypothetical protein
MIHEIRYKGQIINQKDIEVTWSDHFGERMHGSIEDYGASEYNDAWGECEAGEDW